MKTQIDKNDSINSKQETQIDLESLDYIHELNMIQPEEKEERCKVLIENQENEVPETSFFFKLFKIILNFLLF